MIDLIQVHNLGDVATQLPILQEMKRQGIKLVLVEPYFDLKTPNAVARETGAKVLVMPPSVGGVVLAAMLRLMEDRPRAGPMRRPWSRACAGLASAACLCTISMAISSFRWSP